MMSFTAKYVEGTLLLITVDDWDRECWFSDAFLEDTSPNCLQRQGDEFTITVNNGKARYRIIEDKPEMAQVYALMVEAEIDTLRSLPSSG
mgnify:CR=1 FL=1